jgi:hypothetical protein
MNTEFASCRLGPRNSSAIKVLFKVFCETTRENGQTPDEYRAGEHGTATYTVGQPAQRKRRHGRENGDPGSLHQAELQVGQSQALLDRLRKQDEYAPVDGCKQQDNRQHAQRIP